MGKARRDIHKPFIAFAAMLFLLSIDYLGLFEGMNAYLLDLSFRLRGPRPTDGRIVIAAIDGKTLEALGRWPLRRSYYADFLDRTGEAAVVGFDILLPEPSADDAALAAAIDRHGRVVLPVHVAADGKNVRYPAGNLAAARTGHVHVELGSSGKVREIFHTLYVDGRLLPSLSSVLYEAATGERYRRQTPPPVIGGIAQADPMGINYYGAPRSFRYLSFLDILADRYPPAFFRDKIVLLGVTAAGLPDQILAPFPGRLPAVELQATAVGNLLDGSRLRQMPDWALRSVAVILFGLCFFLPPRLADRRLFSLWLAGLLLVALAAFTAFARLNLWAPPVLPGFAVLSAGALAHLYRLDAMTRQLDREYAAIAARLGWPSATAGNSLPLNGLPGAVSANAIGVKIEMFVRVVEELLSAYQALEAESAERIRTLGELRQKEQMLIQQSRMAAMGEMLNNIAHQWRQPLNVLSLTLQQLGLLHEAGQLNRELLDSKIAKATEILLHLSQTIDDFRKFSAPDKEKSRFLADRLIAGTVSLVEESFQGQQIAIVTEAEGEPQIDGYPNEFGQVLLNILMNARDAFLERGKGEARILVRAWTESGRAVVTVTDNAGGIDETIMDKIFDPYFTTKELGKGTGVGLFMSKSIIEKMGGRLSVRNTGDGAEFRIEV